jgi:hypothetical protein
LAALARRNLLLPSPVIKSSPPLGQPQLIRLPTRLWISRTLWTPVEKTAAVPGESVTATAVPAVVIWQMGDGRKVTCDGPGTPYTAAYSPSSPSPDCGYTYTQPSAAQPGTGTTRIILAGARDFLDFTKPVALLLIAILHFIPDAEDPAGIVAAFREALAPGSFLALSSGAWPARRRTRRRAQAVRRCARVLGLHGRR